MRSWRRARRAALALFAALAIAAPAAAEDNCQRVAVLAIGPEGATIAIVVSAYVTAAIVTVPLSAIAYAPGPARLCGFRLYLPDARGLYDAVAP